MRFEHERPGNFTIFPDRDDIVLLSTGARKISGVRGGLKGPLSSKVSVAIDEYEVDRVEFDPGLDMTVYLFALEVAPIVIDRDFIDSSEVSENRTEVLNYYFGETGTVIVEMDTI